MWYESEMIEETLISISESLKYATIPVNIDVAINMQTYLETPINEIDYNKIPDLVKKYLPNANISFLTNDIPFYNIGDWRREKYDSKAKYNIWLESDCLVTFNFFAILSLINIQTPHLLTFASRKMWDKSWESVEHPLVSLYHYDKNHDDIIEPYSCGHYINQEQLNAINNTQDLQITQIPILKIDGALVCLSNNLPTPFINENLHFCREDTYLQWFMQRNNIPQFHVVNILKGHNYNHPLKRTNTNSTRNDVLYNQYKKESDEILFNYFKNRKNE
jgi:hypothetical protein